MGSSNNRAEQSRGGASASARARARARALKNGALTTTKAAGYQTFPDADIQLVLLHTFNELPKVSTKPQDP